MMLEDILEAWVEKIRHNIFPLLGKTLVSNKNLKKLTITSLTASQQPLFAVLEDMTHPVGQF